tara:strand:- start:7091 stop:7462 length:372 start_codon:yes stop_codon:yes gene_type:complete
MPNYTYTNKDTGETIHQTWSISEMLKQEGDKDGITHEGQFYYRNYTAEHARTPVGGCASWPMKSDAAGVHPDQCQEFSENSAKMGVSTEFDKKTGQAIFTSRSHRAKYLKAMGFHDRNGGYGD